MSRLVKIAPSADDGESESRATRNACGCQSLPPVLSARECAALLGMKSDAEVKRLARERRLPSVKFGKRVLFLTDQVIATLRKLERPVVDDAAFSRRGRVDRVAEQEE